MSQIRRAATRESPGLEREPSTTTVDHEPSNVEHCLQPTGTNGPVICVLIPTYNNETTISDVVDQCLVHGLPVLVVDDGSTDSSGQRARDAGAEVVAHEVNRGKGQALLTGWQAASEQGFSHVIAIDADGQHLPEELPGFVENIRSNPDAIVVGVRPHRAENVPRSASVGRAISDFMLWAAAADEIQGERPDTQCGYRAYPIAHVLGLGLSGRRYEMEMEVLVRAAWQGVPLRCLPIGVHYPSADERVSHFRAFRDNVRIVGIYTRLMLMRLFWPVFRPRTKLVPQPKQRSS